MVTEIKFIPNDCAAEGLTSIRSRREVGPSGQLDRTRDLYRGDFGDATQDASVLRLGIEANNQFKSSKYKGHTAFPDRGTAPNSARMLSAENSLLCPSRTKTFILREIRAMCEEKSQIVRILRFFGGPGRDRTDDLFHAMEARSQTAPQAHNVAEMQLFYFLRWRGIRQCREVPRGSPRVKPRGAWLGHEVVRRGLATQAV